MSRRSAAKRAGACAVAFAALTSGVAVRADDGCIARSAIPPSIKAEIRARRGDPTKYVYQEFPGPSGNETAWLVGWAHEPHAAIFITGAYFRPGKNKKFIKVLGPRSGLIEIYVPYAATKPGDRRRERYWDMRDYGYVINGISEAEKGMCGYLLDSKTGLQVRDRDLVWKARDHGLRGHEMVLWGSQNAGNYDYLVHYNFLDDGRIQFRLAATAQNLPGHEHMMHTHTGVWRLNIDLNGDGHPNSQTDKNDRARVLTYVERSGNVEPKATLKSAQINGGKEGAVDWNPQSFTTIAVRDKTLKNARGTPTEYWLASAYRGVVRHDAFPEEAIFAHDFWVTRNKGDDEFYPQAMAEYANGENIENADVVVWAQSPILHIHRNEDGSCGAPTTQYGCPAMWSGIALAMHSPALELIPRNIFDTTPFYPLPDDQISLKLPPEE